MAIIKLNDKILITVDKGRATCDVCRVERMANTFLKVIARNHDIQDNSETAVKLTKLIGGKIII
ncbi:MAG: hypothetical protein V4642_03820 [Bacteroidota bacterium]